MAGARRILLTVVALAAIGASLFITGTPVGSSAEPSRWYFTNQLAGGGADDELDFGASTGTHFVVGDWDGNGIDDLAGRDGNVFTLYDTVTRATTEVGYGKAEDEVFVGDWDGNGTDTFAVRRGNVFLVRNSVTSGSADAAFGYGKAGDEVLVGDWDGNGTDTFAVRRGNVFFVRNSSSTGNADVTFGYGRAADAVLVGDWDGNAIDTFAVRRGNEIFVRNDTITAPAEFSFAFGKATDDLYSGDWDGDGADTFAVRRVIGATPPGPSPPPVPTPSPTPTPTPSCSPAPTPLPGAPAIDVWHCDTTTVGGSKGVSQRWANVLGQVSAPGGVASLTASLNGGVARPISLGPNGRRLVAAGDFNVDTLVSDLQAGSNTIILTATSNAGAVTERTLTINYTPGASPLVSQTIDWSSGTMDSLAQHVDGHWILDGGGVRTAEPGYDRLLAVGDIAWSDYEVTVPFTINSFVAQPGPSSGNPGVGMLLRWNGHNSTVTPNSQPLQGWYPNGGVDPTPLGALPFLRNGGSQRLHLYDHRTVLADVINFPFGTGVEYFMKAKADTQPNGTTVYSVKVWVAGSPEPGYALSFTAGTTDNQPAAGSIVLLAHEADVTFGNVTINPIP